MLDFQYTLALALGMTHRDMMQRMTTDEFAHWLAKDSIDPIGHARQDAAADTIANVIVAVNTPAGKQFKPRKYTPDYRQAHKPPQTDEQIKSAMVKANGLLGGTFK